MLLIAHIAFKSSPIRLHVCSNGHITSSRRHKPSLYIWAVKDSITLRALDDSIAVNILPAGYFCVQLYCLLHISKKNFLQKHPPGTPPEVQS